MVKHLQTGFSVLLVSIVHKTFATKRKKMYIFFIISCSVLKNCFHYVYLQSPEKSL